MWIVHIPIFNKHWPQWQLLYRVLHPLKTQLFILNEKLASDFFLHSIQAFLDKQDQYPTQEWLLYNSINYSISKHAPIPQEAQWKKPCSTSSILTKNHTNFPRLQIHQGIMQKSSFFTKLTDSRIEGKKKTKTKAHKDYELMIRIKAKYTKH